MITVNRHILAKLTRKITADCFFIHTYCSSVQNFLILLSLWRRLSYSGKNRETSP